MKQRVVVGMSGGVDSSVAAALLKEQGFRVIGVYILGWLGETEFPCDWQKEEADARAVAQQLDIPFYTINLSTEYKEAVIDRFFEDYQLGITPNPDILCNQEIKFKALWQELRQFEPDYFATGHYARISQRSGKPTLEKGLDPQKDQSYFLWGIDRSVLSHVLFPIGTLRKAQVRQLAEKFGLPTAKKKDSQGICFVGPLRVRQFLHKYLKTEAGEAFLTDGRPIAHHEGLQFYTIGQRLGAGSVEWTGDVPPLFVVAKDIDNNRLIVAQDYETYADELIAVKPNWLGAAPSKQFVCQAKIRYRQEDVPASVAIQGQELIVRFNASVRAITPGQSIVFYVGDQLLGGAIIQQVPKQAEIIRQVNESIATFPKANSRSE